MPRQAGGGDRIRHSSLTQFRQRDHRGQGRSVATSPRFIMRVSHRAVGTTESRIAASRERASPSSSLASLSHRVARISLEHSNLLQVNFTSPGRPLVALNWSRRLIPSVTVSGRRRISRRVRSSSLFVLALVTLLAVIRDDSSQPRRERGHFGITSRTTSCRCRFIEVSPCISRRSHRPHLSVELTMF